MKNLKLFSVIFLLTFVSSVFAATSAKPNTPKITSEKTIGIAFFKGTWQEALKKAAQEDKLIFMDAYASWCGPCKIMSRGTFTDSKVGAFFNENFINYKMDMEKHPEGKRLDAKYKLTAYPTLFFIDKNEKVFHQYEGYMKPKPFLGLGKRVMTMQK